MKLDYEVIALWSQVLCFVAFAVAAIWIWQRAIAPAVIKAQATQNLHIAELEARLEKVEREREEARASNVRARDEAELIVSRVGELVVREREKYLAEIREEGERELRSAQGELERSRHAARERLRDETLAAALDIARERAVSLVNPSTEARLRDRFVGSLGENR